MVCTIVLTFGVWLNPCQITLLEDTLLGCYVWLVGHKPLLFDETCNVVVEGIYDAVAER